jgi:hypothetical protein
MAPEADVNVGGHTRAAADRAPKRYITVVMR